MASLQLMAHICLRLTPSFTVHRLVARDTVEERIVKLDHDKRDLVGNLLDGTDISGKISADELLRLIREQ